MNTSNSEILNREPRDSSAVKVTLVETHVIQETKNYHGSQAVLPSAFSSRLAWSDTTILVENFPYGTTVDQIREPFEPRWHGELSIGTSGTVVEFEWPNETAKGFHIVSLAVQSFT